MTMKTFCLFLLFAVLSQQALGRRIARQAPDDEEDLEDRYGRQNFGRPNNFPGFRPNQNGFGRPGNGQLGGNGQPTPTVQAQPNTIGNGDAAVQACITNCPATAEYNPVCGTNLVQYSNPGRLECARNCGVNVSLLRATTCPLTTPAPST